MVKFSCKLINDVSMPREDVRKHKKDSGMRAHYGKLIVQWSMLRVVASKGESLVQEAESPDELTKILGY